MQVPFFSGLGLTHYQKLGFLQPAIWIPLFPTNYSTPITGMIFFFSCRIAISSKSGSNLPNKCCKAIRKKKFFFFFQIAFGLLTIIDNDVPNVSLARTTISQVLPERSIREISPRTWIHTMSTPGCPAADNLPLWLWFSFSIVSTPRRSVCLRAYEPYAATWKVNPMKTDQLGKILGYTCTES